jgi:hypothetical protein
MPLQAREHAWPTGDCRWPRKLVQEISMFNPGPERCPEAGIGRLFSAWLGHLEHSEGLAESHVRSSCDRPSPAPQTGQGMFTRQLSLRDVAFEVGSPEPAPSCPDLQLDNCTSVPGPTSEMGIRWTPILGSHHQHLSLGSPRKVSHSFQAQDLTHCSSPAKPFPTSRATTMLETLLKRGDNISFSRVHLLGHSIYVCPWYFHILVPLFSS